MKCKVVIHRERAERLQEVNACWWIVNDGGPQMLERERRIESPFLVRMQSKKTKWD